MPVLKVWDSTTSTWKEVGSGQTLDSLTDVTITTPATGSVLTYDGSGWVNGSCLENPMTAAGDIIIGGTSGTPTRLAKGTDGQVLTLVSGLPSWAAASGGSAAIDWANPVSVTTTANLTIGKHHVCSGTTADYTVTLPAVSGNAGKLLSVEMSGALTKLVTLDGNGSETIDGATTRVMWANETAVLLCDGIQWVKVAGKSVPMHGSAAIISANQTVTATVTTAIALNTAYQDIYFDDVSNNRLIIPRTGKYLIHGAVRVNSNNTTATYGYVYVSAGSQALTSFTSYNYLPASTGVTMQTQAITCDLIQGDYVKLYVYYNAGSYTTSFVANTTGANTAVWVSEIPQW